MVVLYHQLPMGETEDPLIEEIRRAGYGGRLVWGRDLDVF